MCGIGLGCNPAATSPEIGGRAPLDSFDSGNSNRDEHMKEAVEAARYPLVELKAATSPTREMTVEGKPVGEPGKGLTAAWQLPS